MAEEILDFGFERFSEDEASILAHYFSDVSGPVFCLVNLTESVKAALFSRYSRSSKSMRRIFLDEFYQDGVASAQSEVESAGSDRADRLFTKVISEYGDDSVAQLGGVHIAFEGVSNLLTKVIERHRLMSYLEQSTRYLNFGRRSDGTFPYLTPRECDGEMSHAYRLAVDGLFETYEYVTEAVRDYLVRSLGHPPTQDEARAIKAASFDAARGILPAATVSNVGVYGSPQGLESLIMHLRASELVEARELAELARAELMKVIPTFLARLDQPDRGIAWVEYLREKRRDTAELVSKITMDKARTDPVLPSVDLYEFDPDGESRIAEAILFDSSDLSVEEARSTIAQLSATKLDSLFEAYCGNRANRRHRPGRAFEATEYGFAVVSDYGSFRDLQRHRLLSVEWQPLGVELGYDVPELVISAGVEQDYRIAMQSSAELYHLLKRHSTSIAASYAVSMAYGIRYRFRMNAREAMHVLELRSQPSGHPNYRRVVQMMHRELSELAGHRRVAAAMRFVDHESEVLGRLDEERRASSRRALTE